MAKPKHNLSLDNMSIGDRWMDVNGEIYIHVTLNPAVDGVREPRDASEVLGMFGANVYKSVRINGKEYGHESRHVTILEGNRVSIRFENFTDAATKVIQEFFTEANLLPVLTDAERTELAERFAENSLQSGAEMAKRAYEREMKRYEIQAQQYRENALKRPYYVHIQD